MMPWEMRALPRHRQIELMGHRREARLRNSHAEHVRQKVSKRQAEEEGKKK